MKNKPTVVAASVAIESRYWGKGVGQGKKGRRDTVQMRDYDQNTDSTSHEAKYAVEDRRSDLEAKDRVDTSGQLFRESGRLLQDRKEERSVEATTNEAKDDLLNDDRGSITPVNMDQTWTDPHEERNIDVPIVFGPRPKLTQKEKQAKKLMSYLVEGKTVDRAVQLMKISTRRGRELMTFINSTIGRRYFWSARDRRQRNELGQFVKK